MRMIDCQIICLLLMLQLVQHKLPSPQLLMVIHRRLCSSDNQFGIGWTDPKVGAQGPGSVRGETLMLMSTLNFL